MSPNNTSTGGPVTVASANTKGGVGKSTLSVALTTVLRMSGAGAFTTALVDLDGSTGTSINRMGERDERGELKEEQSYDRGVLAFDLSDQQQRSMLFDVTEAEDRFLVLDCPAGSLKMLGRLSENLGASDWADHNKACGRGLVVMIAITPHMSSIVGVRDAIDLFGSAARYVVVRSMRGCKPEDYVLWDEPDFHDQYGRLVSGQSKDRLAEVGGTVIDMPALNAGVLARAEALNVPFADALRSRHLRPYERMEIRRWLEAWTVQLDKIRGDLGLDASFEWRVE